MSEKVVSGHRLPAPEFQNDLLHDAGFKKFFHASERKRRGKYERKFIPYPFLRGFRDKGFSFFQERPCGFFYLEIVLLREPHSPQYPQRVFFQAEDGIRDDLVTGVQTCALPI